jgi:predicted nucleic acid-binding Zn ribbon protein
VPTEPEEPQEPQDRPGPLPGPEAEKHHEDGLDLARSIARGLAGARRTAKKRPPRPGQRMRRVEPTTSGAHPDDRDPQLLDSTIGRLVADQGWATDVRVHGVFTRWEHLVGRDVALHCTPESFDDGKLTVRTDSTAWATQMRLLAPTVLRRLNGELGDGTVTLIEVRGPTGPTWKRGPRSVRDGRGPRDTYG